MQDKRCFNVVLNTMSLWYGGLTQACFLLVIVLSCWCRFKNLPYKSITSCIIIWEQTAYWMLCLFVPWFCPCPYPALAVDCEWGTWSEWGPCSATCDLGVQRSERAELRARQYGGAECQGPSTRSRSCSGPDCGEHRTVLSTQFFYLVFIFISFSICIWNPVYFFSAQFY